MAQAVAKPQRLAHALGRHGTGNEVRHEVQGHEDHQSHDQRGAMSTDKAAAFIGGIKVSKAEAMNHVPIRTVTYRASTQPALSSAPHQFADQLATKSELKKKEVLSILQNLSEIDASGVTATTGKPFDSFCKLMNVGFDAKASSCEHCAPEVCSARAVRDQDSCLG